jgi:hypothetical protein
MKLIIVSLCIFMCVKIKNRNVAILDYLSSQPSFSSSAHAFASESGLSLDADEQGLV